MDGWMDGWVGGWVDGWVGGWMGGWMDGWMDGYGLVFVINSYHSRSSNTKKSQVTDGYTDPGHLGCEVGMINHSPPTEFRNEVITRSTLHINEWH